jgi:2-dehydropantoate 2-reductase
MSQLDPLRIAVYGVGAVGGYFGGRLADAGHDVTFIARGETLAALQSTGLRVDSINGDFVVFPARATDDPERVGPVDLVLLGVKAWQVEAAADHLRPMVGEATVVLPLQNGVEAVDQLVRALGAEHVLGGLCKIISFRVGAGHINHAGATPYVALGELDDRPSERVGRIRTAFDLPGILVEIPPDIRAAIWAKFLFIAAASGIGAATRATVGEIREIAATRALLEQSMLEIEAVARAHGVDLPRNVLETTMAFVDSLPADGTASMQRDIMNGLPSELDSQTGAVVRLAGEVGVDVPVNTVLHTLLQPLERRARSAA